MAYLAENWFVTPLFDVEYKQYQVLDYVQKLRSHFEEKALFPYFDDLLRHIENLETLTKIQTDFEKNLFKTPSYSHPYQEESNLMKDSVLDLKEIFSFASQEFNKCRLTAERVLNVMLEKIQISQLGLINPNTLGGMVLINQNSLTRIYTYEHRIIQRPNTYFQYKDIRTQFAKVVPTSENHYNLKWDLLKSESIHAGINTYVVDCDGQLPYFETVIPLVKNHLLTTGFDLDG